MIISIIWRFGLGNDGKIGLENHQGSHAEAQACPEFIEGKHERSGLYALLSTRLMTFG